MMIDGQWQDNITCPACRCRHPAVVTCEYARIQARSARLVNDQALAASHETLRDKIGQAIADYMTANCVDGGVFAIDAFNSHEIDAIADAVLPVVLEAGAR